MPETQVYEIQDFALASGDTLPVARIAYRTYGTLNDARDNAVLFPTWFTSRLATNEWLIGPGRALDTERFFIVSVALLGNGESSSPSNTPAPLDGPRFPPIDVIDNVEAQHALVTRGLGIAHLHLVIGRSMGAQTAFQWACRYPDMVARLLPFTGSARTTPHNYAFLAGVEAALRTDQTFADGDYTTPPLAGLRTVGLLYAGWAMSQRFYRDDGHLAFEPDIDSYLEKRWAGNFTDRDANDVLAQIGAWKRADVSRIAPYGGDWEAALAAMTMPAIVMPSATDLYFPPEDSARAVAGMPNAELRIIPSDWGHRAGGPGSPANDIAFIEQAIRDVLAR
ncbi:MAG: alpha/beta fold hydrolase [Pseudomonadota bacterium]|nr:alpha/beta fold hydrolase [Pseudomonadota bacterium]